MLSYSTLTPRPPGTKAEMASSKRPNCLILPHFSLLQPVSLEVGPRVC